EIALPTRQGGTAELIAPPSVNAPAAANALFGTEGEQAFDAGDYAEAARAWRHALLDDPQNGTLVMMLAQALFAAGQYEEAAGATQQAMQMLPQDQWGVVVKNYTELYG